MQEVKTADVATVDTTDDTGLQLGDTPAAKDLDQHVVELKKQLYVDVSNGLPFASAQEIIDASMPLFLHQVTRIPIIAVKEGDEMKVYALFRQDLKHETLWENISKMWEGSVVKPDVAFVTAIEDIRPIPTRTESNPPNEHEGPYLRLMGNDRTVYFQLASRSGITDSTEPRYTNHPLKGKDLNTSGPQVVRDFFAKIPGAKVVNLPTQ